MFLPANACVIRHFHKRRALANGLAFCGTGFGTFTFSLLINHLISEYGWRWALFMTSGMLLNGVPCALLLTSPSKVKDLNQHESTLRSRTEHTQSISTIVGRIFLGWLGDKMFMYRRAIFECTVSMQGIAIATMPLLQTFKLKLVVTCAFGFTMGCYVMLFGVVLADEFGPEQIGKSYGLNIFAFGLSTFFAVPLAGWIYDVSHNYDLPFYVGGAECLLATLCLLALRITTKTKQTNSINIEYT